MGVRIAVVGSLNMDLVVRTPHLPEPGETILGGSFHENPGGKGANQAVAAARLGARVSMVGRVGQDAFGDAALLNLAGEGIDHRHVRLDSEHPTGVAFIVVDDDGQNSIVVASGANSRLSPADVDAAANTISGADVLLLQLESPVETVIRAALIARVHAVMVVLNPAPARQLPAHLLADIDVLVPNEGEAALLAGMAVDDLDAAVAAAGALREMGIATVILTLGGRGALLAHEAESEHFPAFDVEVVDTTAAGDAFVAALAVALAEGREIAQAVRWANAAGALAATRLGAQTSLPARDAVDRLSRYVHSLGGVAAAQD